MTKFGERCDRCSSSVVRKTRYGEECARCGEPREEPSATPFIDSAIRSFVARDKEFGRGD